MNALIAPATIASPPAKSPPPHWRFHVRKVGVLLGLGIFLFLGWEIIHVLVGDNFHVLIPGRVYRGAQPSGGRIETMVARHGIRTVVNLRGCCSTLDWYWEEARACQKLNVAMEDVTFSAGRIPSALELKRLVEILDRAEYPIFIHCRRGADRTGLMSALILLLQTDIPLAQARPAMGLRYGHLNLGRTAYLDQFFQLYENWLAKEGREHNPETLRHWLTQVYEGGWLRYRFEECLPLKSPLRVGQPIGYQVKVRNLGDRPWEIKRHIAAGVHLVCRIYDDQEVELWQMRGALFDQTIDPGECLEATIVLPSLPRPGRYRLYLDLVEENHCTFLQAGAKPLDMELEVRE